MISEGREVARHRSRESSPGRGVRQAGRGSSGADPSFHALPEISLVLPAFNEAPNIVELTLRVGVRDCDCALKLFRRSMLDRIELESEGFPIHAEILSRIHDAGGRVAEVGVRHRPRVAGESTITPFDALPVTAALWRFWWSRSKSATMGASPAGPLEPG